MSQLKRFKWRQPSVIWIFVILVNVTIAPPKWGSAERSLSPEDVESILSFPPAAILAVSPDGQFVAYALNDPRRRGEFIGQSLFTNTGVSLFGTGCDVWLTNTQTGHSENLTKGQGSSWAPVWSPDGNYLAFYSDRAGSAQLWVRENSGTIRRLSDETVRALSSWQTPVWTNDSKHVITKILSQGMSVEQANQRIGAPPSENAPPVLVYTSPASAIPQAWHTSGLMSDLAMMDVRNGTVQRQIG